MYTVHAASLQELRLESSSSIAEAKSWAWRHNFRLSVSKALRTGTSVLSTSSGSACMWRKDVPAKEVPLGALEEHGSRFHAAVINVGIPVGVLLVSVYLKD
eukprot:6487801-Karenia_brevis.AAC.1